MCLSRPDLARLENTPSGASIKNAAIAAFFPLESRIYRLATEIIKGDVLGLDA
jgi:hypothetical protein